MHDPFFVKRVLLCFAETLKAIMEIEQRNNKEDTKREEVMETQKVYISYYHLQE